MKEVDTTNARFKGVSSQLLPSAVSLFCPHCSGHVIFTLNAQPVSPRNGVPIPSQCPNCTESVRFWITEEPGRDRRGWLFAHPDPKIKEPIAGLEDVGIPKPLVDAYEESVAALNAELWSSAAVNARRTLEGLTKLLMDSPSDRRPLAKLLRELPKTVDLSAPIVDVAELVKDGGNLGAHLRHHVGWTRRRDRRSDG